MVTLQDLGLKYGDFKVEIIEMKSPTYNNHMNPFRPSRTFIAKVNGVICTTRTSLNIEMINDLQSMSSINPEREIKSILVEEAVNNYINSIQYIRKLKLEKINKNAKG